MASSSRFRVDLETLASSAAHVAGQGEDLATAHLSSDNQIISAQSGWVGSSALALNATTAAWLETSRRFVTRVGDHATGINGAGIRFASMEKEATAALDVARRELSPMPGFQE